MAGKLGNFIDSINKRIRGIFISERTKSLGFAILTSILLSIAGVQFESWIESRLLIEAQAHFNHQIHLYGVSLTQAVNSKLALINGISNFLETELTFNEGEIDEDELLAMVAKTYENSTAVRNIPIAPGGVMQFVYPYEENKSVLGYEPAVDDRPHVRDDVERAITKKVAILSLPIELIQGGLGIIARQAVFVEDEYWGLSNVVIDVNMLLEEASIINGSNTILLSIKDQSGNTFYGPESVFENNPVIYSVPLTEGSWELAGIPAEGWQNYYQSNLRTYQLLIISVIVLSSFLVYITARRQERLTSLVALRTNELSESNLQLELDIKRRKQVETELKENQNRMEKVLSNSPVPIVLTKPNGDIEYYNNKFIEVFGYTLETVSTAEQWWQNVYPNPEYRQLVRESWENAIAIAKETGKQIETQEWDMVCYDGSTRRVEFNMMPLGGLSVITMNDITIRKESEEKLQHLATHDSLTGLPNRILLSDQLTRACAAAKRLDESVYILFIDLDNFKSVNDAFGHKQGDWLLKHVALRMKNALRETDSIARFGGDEFVVLLTGIKNPSDAVLVAEKLINEISEPFSIQGSENFITSSIGISIFPSDGEDIDALVQNADKAMYQAKTKGKNNFQFYSPEIETEILKRLELKNELRQAIANEQFRLHYQPQVDSSSGKVIGVEALLRWEHPTRGLTPPGDFLQQAEESGLIVPIGEWVLKTACKQMRTWMDKNLPAFRFSVNISGRELNKKELFTHITNTLKENRISPSLLELELTENIVFQDLNNAQPLLKNLKKLGVRIAVDDFGVGYSTLSQLANFAFDTLKIDRYFANRALSSPKDAAVVKGIITVAKNLDLNIIVEGVEDTDQLGFFKQHGCEYIQGYVFSKPLPPEEFEKFLIEGIPEK